MRTSQDHGRAAAEAETGGVGSTSAEGDAIIILACLSCHHQHHQLHHQHYRLDLHHILTKSPSQMREAEQRLAEEQQSMLGLQVKILPALWTQCWSWQWSWSWS